jgi:hypothetical protein
LNQINIDNPYIYNLYWQSPIDYLTV